MISSLETEKYFMEFWCTVRRLMDMLVKRLMVFSISCSAVRAGSTSLFYVDYSDGVNRPK